ncbi:hypothetical protein P153DRAFT_255933, partial [Dothidotthia symphoricarpi CBS 119687]
FFDPLGETEPSTTVYTLTVLCPPRPPPRWLPKFFTRTPVSCRDYNSTHFSIRPRDDDPRNPNYDCFELYHLNGMKRKTVKIKCGWFPLEMRCVHVQNGTKRCDEGCYVLEKGGDLARWMCKQTDCEGHVYCDNVVEDGDKVVCFGKK